MVKSADSDKNIDRIEKIVSLMKQKGFIFRSSDIYGGLNGFFDYGSLEVELKSNIKEIWWIDVVKWRDDFVGLDCSLISPHKVWEASGHLAGFSDPILECKESKMRLRADQLVLQM
jgi:glycyl-tRNA synthetase